MLIRNCALCQLLLELKVTPFCGSSLQRSVPGSINWSVATSTERNYAPPGSWKEHNWIQDKNDTRGIER